MARFATSEKGEKIEILSFICLRQSTVQVNQYALLKKQISKQ